MNTINTTTANTVNNIVEDQQTATAVEPCGMTKVAGFLFGATVLFQCLVLGEEIIDYDFANHIIYQILPLTGVLAYFGLKKDLTTIATQKNKCDQTPDSDC